MISDLPHFATFSTITQTARSQSLIQIINPVGSWYVPFIDLRSLDPVSRELEIDRIAQAQACQIFNLAPDVLLRSSLLICAPTEHILLLTLHHISVDAWSIGVFFRELSAIYAAFASSKPSPLAALPVQYADFAIWQKQHLQGQMLAADLNTSRLSQKFSSPRRRTSHHKLRLQSSAVVNREVLEQHGQIDIAASLTVTNSTQGIAPIPGWELVEMQTKQQHWDDISAELYAPETPLEFYIEMSKPMRVMVNYGIDRYTEESISQLLIRPLA